MREALRAEAVSAVVAMTRADATISEYRVWRSRGGTRTGRVFSLACEMFCMLELVPVASLLIAARVGVICRKCKR
jgi:hypothetical protein